MPGVVGEGAQAKGADGARRAKRWLDSTTRANAVWINPEPSAVKKLTFHWPHDEKTFSFDLGGFLKHGDFDGEFFYAESKKYDGVSDLNALYVDYLAKCYVAYLQRQELCDNFMWISWAPPLSSRWAELCTAAFVREAVLRHRVRVLNEPDEQKAEALVDDSVCAEVAKRLWLIVLSDRQETLVISPEHRALVEGHVVRSQG